MNVWKIYKKNKLERLKKDLKNVDPDILSLLEAINNMDSYVTLSSCSGRIVIIDLLNFGKKEESNFLGKWHREVKIDEVISAVKKGKKQTWFIMDPPILHVACKSLEAAKELMKIANCAGFKRIGLISLKNYVLEITTLERVETLLALNGKMLVDRFFLNEIVKIANEKLKKSKEKLKKLEIELKKIKSR
ncbi:hypothetical protein DRO30_01520 [Candidatus Bathyarchaeota archaeon]|nr:MAG: hypothetical protein DRO30_01520 [Candidatus Bathyarchaeota archaeon]